MENWVWIIIGFIGGVIVYAILNLVFAKDPPDEMEKLADERAAELAKNEMKTAVLQDKLVATETERDEQREKSEAECRQKLAEADASFQQNLEQAEEDCQQRLAAAEEAYLEKLAHVEQQFADLQNAFSRQAAEVGASIVAAGLAGSASSGDLEGNAEGGVDLEIDDEGSFTGEDLESGTGTDPESFDEAAAAAVIAALAADFDDESALDEDLDEEEERAELAAETAAVETDEDGDFAEIEEEESDGHRAAAVVGGAAIAAAVLVGDGEDEAPDGQAESAAAEDAGESEYLEVMPSEEEVFEEDIFDLDEEALAFSYGTNDAEEDGADLEQEDGSHTAAAVLAGATAAAVIGADGDDGEEEGGEYGAPYEQPAGDGAEDEGPLTPAEEDETADQSVEDTEEEALEVESEAEMDGAVEESDPDALDAGVAAAALVADAAEESEVDDTGTAEEAEEEDVGEGESSWPEDTSVWTGAFYNNMKLEGEPVLIREDAEIDFDWGMGSPAPEVNVDRFSARWTRTADLPPGLYRFTVTSDDGARLWVNDRLMISAWYDHTEMTFRREIKLPGGLVELKLEYYENEMAAQVRVSWERIG